MTTTTLEIDYDWMLGVLVSARHRIQCQKGTKKEAFIKEMDKAVKLIEEKMKQ
jgi:hypothetical protein